MTDLKNALEMTGCENEQDLIDMANVGRSLMSAIDTYTAPVSLIEGWSPADDPAEIVGDLYNLFEESVNCHKADLDRLAQSEADRRERIEQCDRMAEDWFKFCEAMGVTWDTQEAVACELQTRFEKLRRALKLAVDYDDLLRRFEGPATIFAGDVEEIDAAYDAWVLEARSALAAVSGAGR